MTKKNKKQNKRRKLILALLMLLISGAVLGTGTYAWFTANKIVTVTTIDVNVATSNGLQISADGKNFKTIVTNKELLAATKAITEAESTGLVWGSYESGINQIPNGTNAMLSPVSTGGSVSSGTLPMYAASIDTNDTTGDSIIVTSDAKETEVNSNTNGKFVAFDIFLKVNSAAQIQLGTTSNVTAKSTETDSGIQNAARVAFVYEGNKDSSAALADIQGLKSTTSTYDIDSTHKDIKTVTIWEPNSKTHTPTGKVNALNVYGKTDNYDADKDEWTIIPYEGLISTISKAENVPLTATSTTHSAKLTPVTPALYSDGALAADTDIFYLNEGITKFRVYMWIEGQDVDCENDASGGAVSLNLQFKMAE